MLLYILNSEKQIAILIVYFKRKALQSSAIKRKPTFQNFGGIIMEYVTLNNSIKMPKLGYGVYQTPSEDT